MTHFFPKQDFLDKEIEKQDSDFKKREFVNSFNDDLSPIFIKTLITDKNEILMIYPDPCDFCMRPIGQNK